MVGSAEFFQRIAKNAYLIGTQEGFTLYKPQQEPAPSQTKCLIRNVEIIGEKSDSMLFYGKPKSILESFGYEPNLTVCSLSLSSPLDLTTDITNPLSPLIF